MNAQKTYDREIDQYRHLILEMQSMLKDELTTMDCSFQPQGHWVRHATLLAQQYARVAFAAEACNSAPRETHPMPTVPASWREHNSTKPEGTKP